LQETICLAGLFDYRVAGIHDGRCRPGERPPLPLTEGQENAMAGTPDAGQEQAEGAASQDCFLWL
jgi:hypothetical protein